MIYLTNYILLTGKTKLSIICSNSSFTACVRNHHHLHYAYTIKNNKETPTCSVNGTTRTKPICNTSHPNKLTAKGSYLFTSCEWSSCHAANGSAIYVSNSDIELKVKICTFHSCEADIDGGGIYAQPADIVHVEHSFFHKCKSKGTGVNDGGGGIWLYSIATEILVTSTDFASCTVEYDGGGVNIWSSSSQRGNKNTVQNCRYVNCYGNNVYKSEGGGACSWSCDYDVGITNTLFSHCSNYHGGGFKTMVKTNPIHNLITFCFFTHNSAYENCGNDACLNPEVSGSPFLYCFTTLLSNSASTYSYSDGGYRTKDGWLPLSTMNVHVPE